MHIRLNGFEKYFAASIETKVSFRLGSRKSCNSIKTDYMELKKNNKKTGSYPVYTLDPRKNVSGEKGRKSGFVFFKRLGKSRAREEWKKESVRRRI